MTVLALVLIGVAPGRAQEIRLAPPGDGIPDSYIVVLKEGVAAPRGTVGRKVSQLAVEMAAGSGGTVSHVFEHALRGFAVRMPEGAARLLAGDPRVAYVEQDRVMHAMATQNNPAWGLDRIDQRDLPLSSTYVYDHTGAGVHAYVVDTGLRSTHSEFAGRVGNGFTAVGDGWGTGDCYGHGTHVAGILGGRTYGVAKEAVLHPVRVLDCTGSGSASGVIAGVDWITVNHVAPAVANMSLGGGTLTSLDEAVNNSIRAGVTYVVSSGNTGDQACNYSPARVAAALTVGSSTASDFRSYFSNYGSCLDLFAPGSDVVSAWNTSDTATRVLSGTSMASPHVAGVVALTLERSGTLNPAAVHAAIVSNATAGKLNDAGTGSPNRLLYSRFGGTALRRPELQDLVSLQRTGASSGTTEVHVLDRHSTYQSFLLRTDSALQETGAAQDWAFLQGDYDRDGILDLYVIKKANTGSFTTEVHILSGASGFQSFLVQTPTALPRTGSDGRWAFALGDYNRDGRDDLFVILKHGSYSGWTEVHVLSGASVFQTWLLNVATPLGPMGDDNRAVFLAGDHDRDGQTDLYLVYRSMTGSGRTEVHVLSGASSYQTWLANLATVLHETGSDGAWAFRLADYDQDGILDLYVIKKANTGSGTTELHVMSGATRFQSWLMQTGTALPETGTDWAWVFP